MSATCVLRLLAILMLVLAPVRALAEGARMADGHALVVALDLGHCDDAGKSPKGQTAPHRHCSLAAPGVAGGVEPAFPPSEPALRAQAWPAAAELRGLPPEATTPPPRAS